MIERRGFVAGTLCSFFLPFLYKPATTGIEDFMTQDQKAIWNSTCMVVGCKKANEKHKLKDCWAPKGHSW